MPHQDPTPAAIYQALHEALIQTGRYHDIVESASPLPDSRGRSAIRMLFVFDPDRAAIFLVAGDKAGRWSRWYDEAIPLAKASYGDRPEKDTPRKRDAVVGSTGLVMVMRRAIGVVAE